MNFFHPPHKLTKKYETKTYCIICFQKPQNTSFPMVYHTWFYDNFEILIFFSTPPPPPYPLINWQKFIKMKTYSLTSFQKCQNTSFLMVYHTWFYDNFKFCLLYYLLFVVFNRWFKLNFALEKWTRGQHVPMYEIMWNLANLIFYSYN